MQESNITFHCKLIFFRAGGCTIRRFANCTLSKPKLAPEGAQRFDASTMFDSRHFGSRPEAFSTARTICFKDEPFVVLVQDLCLRSLGLSEQPHWFATT
ncbi:MAG: hypothetical protein ACREM3_30790, partial [Candidatus Rokuibacteriota bacterium]